MANITDCIFCKIVKKEVSSSILYEDSKVISFLDINPANKGHALVLPKNHYVRVEEVPDSILSEVIKIVKIIGKSFISALGAEGFNILQNNGRVAGQIIDHVHFHVIPRFKEDGLTLGKLSSRTYEEGEMKEITKKIREALMHQ